MFEIICVIYLIGCAASLTFCLEVEFFDVPKSERLAHLEKCEEDLSLILLISFGSWVTLLTLIFIFNLKGSMEE